MLKKLNSRPVYCSQRYLQGALCDFTNFSKQLHNRTNSSVRTAVIWTDQHQTVATCVCDLLLLACKPLCSHCTLHTMHRCTVGQNGKKPAKNQIEKFVKLTDDCTHNNSTSFGCVGRAMTGNGSFVNCSKLAWKNLWNHIKEIYCWRVFAVWNHCSLDLLPLKPGKNFGH